MIIVHFTSLPGKLNSVYIISLFLLFFIFLVPEHTQIHCHKITPTYSVNIQYLFVFF